MAGEDHVAGPIGDAVIGVCGDVIKKVGYGLLGVFSCSCLLAVDVAEGDKDFVVDCTSTVQEGTNDALDSFDAGFVKRLACVGILGELLLGAVRYGDVFVW